MAEKKPTTTTKAAPAKRRPGNARRFDGGPFIGAVLIVAIAVVTVLLANAGDDPERSTVAAGDTGELLRGAPPWAPQNDGLADRVEALGFPPVGDESYHVHALLSVYVDGEQVPVPANIGIDQQARYLSPLHTHTPDGVIHFEADDPAPFTLAQVFKVWGVAFAPDRLGGLTNQGAKTVQVYVDGRRIENPLGYELKDQDNVVVAYGEEGSFPTEPPDDALSTT